MKTGEFFNLYNHGFIRPAVGVPEVRVADPGFNAERTIELMEKAAQEKAVLLLFPELGLSAYSCEDLFHQQALLDGALEALRRVLQSSEALNLVTIVGLPLQNDLLFNCAVIILLGKILGIVPKTFLPNYREFYEYRQFAPASAAHSSVVAVLRDDLHWQWPQFSGQSHRATCQGKHPELLRIYCSLFPSHPASVPLYRFPRFLLPMAPFLKSRRKDKGEKRRPEIPLMFTGIVEHTARVRWMRQLDSGTQLVIETSRPFTTLERGDSVAINGCCLTVTGLKDTQISFDELNETLNRTNLKQLRPESIVNIERPLRATSRLDGHFVQGHIDCTGEVTGWERIKDDQRLEVKFPGSAP